MMNALSKPLLIFILIITSCSQVKYIDIQVLKPSELTLEHPIHQLTIIQSPFTTDKAISSIDTGLIRVFFNHLYDSIEAKLKASPALYKSKLDISSLTDYKKRFVETDFVDRKTNYVIDLQSIALKDSVFTDIDLFLGQNGLLVSRKVGIHQISYAITFTLNNMALIYLNKPISLSDTIEWISPDLVIKNKSTHYTELADIIAMGLMEKTVPYWITAERQIYFVPNQLMRKAYKHFVANNHNAAIQQWEIVYTIGTRPLASKAAFNIALSFELLDNLETSKAWLNKAILVKNDSNFVKYQQIIEKRIEDRVKIDKQIWK